MCFQRKNSHNLTHFRKKSMGVTAQKLKEVLNLIKSKKKGKQFCWQDYYFLRITKDFFQRELSKTSPIFSRGEGVKEKSCFLRTLSQFMFTYWFKKFRVVFHTHALWQKFIVHRFFSTQEKNASSPLIFQKKGD